MDRKIVKVVFDNQTEIAIGEYKTVEQIKTDYTYDKEWKVINHYERQFKDFERLVIKEINEDVVKDFAVDWLDLIEQDDCEDCDCEEKDISDFEDNEILAELANRNLLGQSKVNIVTLDLFSRFSRVMNFADNQELDRVITELETKYRL